MWPWSRIRKLEDDNARAYIALKKALDDANGLRNQVEYLVRTIRDMDQEIWNMSQKTSWDQQRPHFNKLHEATIARKVAESNRIGDILRGELIDTYRPSQKQIGKA